MPPPSEDATIQLDSLRWEVVSPPSECFSLLVSPIVKNVSESYIVQEEEQCQRIQTMLLEDLVGPTSLA